MSRVPARYLAWKACFFDGSFGNSLLGPNLTVRVGIAAAHHRAPVLENLDVIDKIQAAQALDIARPRHPPPNVISGVPFRPGSGRGAARNITPGNTPLALGYQQPFMLKII